MTKTRLNLHEIDREIKDLIELSVDPETGEIDEDLGIELDELGMDRDKKVLNCARYINEHKAIAASYKQHAQRLMSHCKAHEKQAAFLKSWVESSCNTGETFEAPDIGKISFRKSTRAVAHDISIVPDALVIHEVIETEKLDANAAKRWAADHDGEPPSGVTISEHKSMQIR